MGWGRLRDTETQGADEREGTEREAETGRRWGRGTKEGSGRYGAGGRESMGRRGGGARRGGTAAMGGQGELVAGSGDGGWSGTGTGRGMKKPPRGLPRGGHKGLDRRDKASLSARRSSPMYGSVPPMANICRKRTSRPARREARAGRDGNMARSRMPPSPPRSATEKVGAWINVRAGVHGGGRWGAAGDGEPSHRARHPGSSFLPPPVRPFCSLVRLRVSAVIHSPTARGPRRRRCRTPARGSR